MFCIEHSMFNKYSMLNAVHKYSMLNSFHQYSMLNAWHHWLKTACWMCIACSHVHLTNTSCLMQCTIIACWMLSTNTACWMYIANTACWICIVGEFISFESRAWRKKEFEIFKCSKTRRRVVGRSARTLGPAPAGRINSVVAEPQGRRGERPMYLRGWKIDARTRT